MGTGYSRITVVSSDRRVDLSLPSSVALGDLMPQLVDLCTEHRDRTGALAWTLRPVTGPALGWASSLESAQVRDGAVLELCPRAARLTQPTVEDVRDAIEDAVDQTIGTWTRQNTTTMAGLVLAGLAALTLAIPAIWTTTWANGLPVAIACSGALLWAAFSLGGRGLPVGAHALLVVGLGWLGAVVVTTTAQPATAGATLTPAARAALCAGVVLCAALLMTRAVHGLACWSAVAAVAFCASLGWAAMDLTGLAADDAIAVGTVLGVLTLGILPRVSLAAGGLAGLDYLVRTRGSVAPAAVVATFARSRALLTGSLLGTACLVAVGTIALGVGGSSLQVAQVTAIAGCLLLRARAFTQFLHVATLVLAGSTALLVRLGLDLAGGHARLPTFAILVVVVVGSVSLICRGSAVPTDVASARGRRLLDIAESLAVATLVPLLAANLGVLDGIGQWLS